VEAPPENPLDHRSGKGREAANRALRDSRSTSQETYPRS
jgi:hypothetical protein